VQYRTDKRTRMTVGHDSVADYIVEMRVVAAHRSSVYVWLNTHRDAVAT
jgi:hypothetical protein